VGRCDLRLPLLLVRLLRPQCRQVCPCSWLRLCMVLGMERSGEALGKGRAQAAQATALACCVRMCERLTRGGTHAGQAGPRGSCPEAGAPLQQPPLPQVA
jgi:hypothetical protein